MTTDPIRKLSQKDEAKKQEYLLLNYPADIRRNLKAISGLSFEDEKVKPATAVPEAKCDPAADSRHEKKGRF
jgi:hypothetical protein